MRKNDNLKTPPWVYEQLGKIDLDPCAGLDTSIGQTNYAIERGEDGLTLPWNGFVYCNPPFSQKQKWAKRMIEHGNGILILPERGSAPWFGPLAVAAEQYWVMGKKINFIGGSSSNNLGSVLFLFGDRARHRVLNSTLPGHLVEVEKYRGRHLRHVSGTVLEAEKGSQAVVFTVKRVEPAVRIELTDSTQNTLKSKG